MQHEEVLFEWRCDIATSILFSKQSVEREEKSDLQQCDMSLPQQKDVYPMNRETG